jgi:hypothetical protein
MTIRTSRLKLRPTTGVGAILGLALTFTFLPAAAQQPRQPQGQWTQEQRAACEPDAMRLCNQYGSDVQRITVCMSHYRRYLSAACRKVFDRPRGKAKRR